MPSIKQTNVASTGDALQGVRFKNQAREAFVTLYASGVTATDTIGFSVGSQEFLVDANPNVEIAADVVDTERDAILMREPVPPGEYFVRVVATTAVNFLLVIEY